MYKTNKKQEKMSTPADPPATPPPFTDPPTDPPIDPPADPPTDPPADPPTDPDECPPEPCEPILVPMNLEIQPDVTICVDKPTIKLKNRAVCICKPCKPE